MAARRRLSALRQRPLAWAHGVAGIGGYHALYFAALGSAPAVEANLLNYAWPLLIVLLSGILGGLRLGAQRLIGVAMGAAGTDTAMEAADVVVMNDDLRRIGETIRLSRSTHTVLWQNISLALGIKAVFLVLAVFGNATMWMAVFADMGASLLVVVNGLRLLKFGVLVR